MAPHDNAYKLIFSHADMVRDLLQGFVPEDWVKRLNFNTLEKVDGQYVSEDLLTRSNDVVWRLRLNDGEWIYLYVLLEAQHQAVVDHHPNHLQRHLPEMEGAQQSLSVWLDRLFRHLP